MTRNEFLDTVNDWYELIEFCNDVGCSYCDDVYSEESMNDDINERLTDWAQECTWQELYSRLDDIQAGTIITGVMITVTGKALMILILTTIKMMCLSGWTITDTGMKMMMTSKMRMFLMKKNRPLNVMRSRLKMRIFRQQN